MGPDVEGVRQLARGIAQEATRSRDTAHRMRLAEGVTFESPAADRYRAELRQTAADADRAAQELDDAAQALFSHAAEVEQHLRDIAAAEHWFMNRVSDLRGLAADATHVFDSFSSGLLHAARNAPSPGSPDWLDFAARWKR
jgi:hypothetical protein